jgi:hypothetical protein
MQNSRFKLLWMGFARACIFLVFTATYQLIDTGSITLHQWMVNLVAGLITGYFIEFTLFWFEYNKRGKSR